MAISTLKISMIGAVLVSSTLLTYIILSSAVIPQYSVYEFYMENDPSTLVDKKIQIIGDVFSIGNGEFVIGDWETNGSLTIKIFHENVAKPSGFELGKRVMVEGTLKLTLAENSYYVEATLISTKCPTKYQ